MLHILCLQGARGADDGGAEEALPSFLIKITTGDA